MPKSTKVGIGQISRPKTSIKNANLDYEVSDTAPGGHTNSRGAKSTLATNRHVELGKGLLEATFPGGASRNDASIVVEALRTRKL